MTDDQISCIRRTWALAAGDADTTARVFYGTLFRIDPSTRPLFKSDLAAQGRKLMDTLGFIVDHLDALDVLIPAAEDLAIRHVDYGVSKDQYAPVGTALIQTFHKLLGAGFSKDDEAAWTDVYGTLSDVMIRKAYSG